jgi:predicted DNA-binding protein (MmcQ/YjbR family)
MTIADLQSICNKYKAVTEDIKWEDHLCFNVGGKMFIIIGASEVPVTASFKVNDDDFEILSVKPGFKPAPYLARYKWIWMENISLFTKKQWEYYSKTAYNLVSEKLPAKTKKELEL